MCGSVRARGVNLYREDERICYLEGGPICKEIRNGSIRGEGRFCQEGGRADLLGVRGGSFLERCGGSFMG